jgi:hypothetical protein
LFRSFFSFCCCLHLSTLESTSLSAMNSTLSLRLYIAPTLLRNSLSRHCTPCFPTQARKASSKAVTKAPQSSSTKSSGTRIPPRVVPARSGKSELEAAGLSLGSSKAFDYVILPGDSQTLRLPDGRQLGYAVYGSRSAKAQAVLCKYPNKPQARYTLTLYLAIA